jgi:S-DNA-T family DNA segregation ATPase FtsK/SpoIIIE
MATVRKVFRRAVAAHRDALGHLGTVRDALHHAPQEPVYGAECLLEQAALVQEIQQAAEELTPGWWTAPWDSALAERGLGLDGMPGRPWPVRIGTAHPVSEGFPVIVPFIGGGHLSVDADARDPRVSGFVRGVLLRVLAAMPAGSVRVLPVDGGTLGTTFTPLRPLVAAELMTEPAIDLGGVRRVLAEAEEHVRLRQADPGEDRPILVLAAAAFPSGFGRSEAARLASLAHAGVGAGVHLLLAGYPPPAQRGLEPAPPLDRTTVIVAQGDDFRVSDPPGEERFSADGRGVAGPVVLDPGPPEHLLPAVCGRIAERAAADSAVRFADLMPSKIWTESSIGGLRTMAGHAGRTAVHLSLDDVTPHWLLGGRTGSGKTVFLLDILYGLATRYSPEELALYLLDFKEGISFSEFVPTEADPTWIPHARAVGVESDREFGVAVLAALIAEMNRRATAMKQVGVTSLARLRATRPRPPVPRIVAVIDEFHALFAGNDAVAKRASALLEEVARKGRSYGVHLILASQTTSGIEALFAKGEAIFGQFSQRVALVGGGGVLAPENRAADVLAVGAAVLNDGGGAVSANRTARFPDADAAAVERVRHRLWEARTPDARPPAHFAGYAEQHVEDDPTLQRLDPSVRRRSVMIGRAVDIGLPTAAFGLDTTPGRHLAVLGTSEVGAGILHAATLGLARQHAPGTAEFVIAGLVAAADEAVDDAAAAVTAAGHVCSVVDVRGLRAVLGRLVHGDPGGERPREAAYVVVFGADAASGGLKADRDAATGKTGLDDLRAVLADGPTRGVHLIGWWRGIRRFTDDIGMSGKEDVAGLVALNVNGREFGSLIGDLMLEWEPRENRALFVDRHQERTTLIVPFVRPQRGEAW